MKQLLLLLIPLFLFAHQNSPDLPVIVPPYYHYEFNTAEVGKFSKDLGSKDSVDIDRCVKKMAKKPEKLTVEQQFVAAIRLFDMGDTTSALHWYYTARYRMELFRAITDPQECFEIQQAHVAFFRQVGRKFNRITHENPKELAQLIEQILEEQAAGIDITAAYSSISFPPADIRQKAEKDLRTRDREWIAALKKR